MQREKQNTAIKKWNVCRFCMKTSNNKMQQIFGQPNTDELVKNIEQCGGMLMEVDDMMPNKICENCLEMVALALKFRALCQRSFRTWTQIEARMNPEESPTPLEEVVPVDSGEPSCASDIKANTSMRPDVLAAVEESEDENVTTGSVETRKTVYYIDELSYTGDEQMLDLEPQDPAEVTEEKEDSSRQTETKFRIINDGATELLQEHEENPLTVVTEYNYDEEFMKEHDVLDNMLETKLEIVTLDVGALKCTSQEKESKPDAISRSGGPYVCAICGNMYKDRPKLNLHMKLHTKLKRHECEICHKRFAQTPQLARHMNSHTGVRPYNCQYCDSKFADPSTRIKHERIHTHERPYKCDMCSKTFAYSNVLKVHLKMHMGEKPYSCEFCKKRFSQLHHKKSHERTHSNE